ATWTSGDGAVQPLISMAAEFHVVTEYIEHPDHLTKDQNTMSVTLQLREQLVKQHHLSTTGDKCAQDFLSTRACAEQPLFTGRKHKRMIARLLQLHHDVEE